MDAQSKTGEYVAISPSYIKAAILFSDNQGFLTFDEGRLPKKPKFRMTIWRYGDDHEEIFIETYRGVEIVGQNPDGTYSVCYEDVEYSTL